MKKNTFLFIYFSIWAVVLIVYLFGSFDGLGPRATTFFNTMTFPWSYWTIDWGVSIDKYFNYSYYILPIRVLLEVVIPCLFDLVLIIGLIQVYKKWLRQIVSKSQ